MILSFDLMMLGIFTLIIIIVVMIIALKMIAAYYRTKNKSLLFAGLSAVGISAAWSGVALNFISIVFFNVSPPIELYFLFHGSYLAISNFTWVVTCVLLSNLKSKARKLIIILAGIFNAILEIIYLRIIFTDTTILGLPLNEIQVDYAPFSELYLLYSLTMMTILGFWFSIKSLKSNNRKTRLKGKLLFFSFFIFTFAAILEILIPIIPIIIIARILVIISGIFFYGGFILPKWMEKLFLKEVE